MENQTDRFTGQLLRRGDDGYEAARVDRIFHSRHPDRYPVAILRVAIENDFV